MSNIVSDGIAISPGISSPNNLSNAPESIVANNIGEQQPGYNDEFERLKSFPYKWENLLGKRDLSRNGFYCLGPNLPLKCYSCAAEIPQNTSTTSLVTFHREMSEDCNHAFDRETNPPNIPLGDTSDFRFEKNRFISFLGANWFPQVDPGDLAKWGFYWTGVADVGRCNFCRLEVRGWEPNDRGQSEHMRWNPHCPFMQNRAVGNVRLGEEANAHNVQDDTAVTAHRGLVNVIGGASANVEELGVMLTAPPRHPEYASLSTRLGSYSMWPLSMRQRPEQLAESGFYYTSKGDRVICFQCGGGLKDWGQTDLPWVEHAVWFPRCAYLLMKKGREFVSQVQALKNAQLSNTELQAMTRSSISSHQPAVPQLQPMFPVLPAAYGQSNDPAPTAPAADNAAEAVVPPPAATVQNDSANGSAATVEQPMEQANAADSDASEARDMRMCKVCYQKELGIVFLPCGHMATCPDCAPQLTSCPICRARTNAYVRAFLP